MVLALFQIHWCSSPLQMSSCLCIVIGAAQHGRVHPRSMYFLQLFKVCDTRHERKESEGWGLAAARALPLSLDAQPAQRQPHPADLPVDGIQPGLHLPTPLALLHKWGAVVAGGSLSACTLLPATHRHVGAAATVPCMGTRQRALQQRARPQGRTCSVLPVVCEGMRALSASSSFFSALSSSSRSSRACVRANMSCPDAAEGGRRGRGSR